MFGSCPVVQVKSKGPDGFTEINESDFDPTIHTLYAATAYAEMTVKQLMEVLDAAGIDAPEHAKKADLVALCQAAG
jgi:predicted component of type VI protein secretion system